MPGGVGPTAPPDESEYGLGFSVPIEPISQFCAVGGFSTRKLLLAVLFQITMLAPDQPWPVPELPRLRTLISLVAMLSNKAPTDQRWWGPVSALAVSPRPSTKTLG